MKCLCPNKKVIKKDALLIIHIKNHVKQLQIKERCILLDIMCQEACEKRRLFGNSCFLQTKWKFTHLHNLISFYIVIITISYLAHYSLSCLILVVNQKQGLNKDLLSHDIPGEQRDDIISFISKLNKFLYRGGEIFKVYHKLDTKLQMGKQNWAIHLEELNSHFS